jgi:hypothetical protein
MVCGQAGLRCLSFSVEQPRLEQPQVRLLRGNLDGLLEEAAGGLKLVPVGKKLALAHKGIDIAGVPAEDLVVDLLGLLRLLGKEVGRG